MSQPFTTHKKRADWFQQRTTYPKREAYPGDLDRTRAADGPVWTEVGPPDIGGRLTAMAVDPSHPDHVFVGSAGGGVWYTTDAGRHWRGVWSDQERTLSIGSLALDPRDSQTLYVGTGEANLSGDDYPGVGVFRSKDRGATWELAGDVADRIVAKTFQGITRQYLAVGLPRRIGALAIDPFDSLHIMAGGVTHNDMGVAALFETRDGGKNWDVASDANGPLILDGAEQKGIFISPLNYFCHAVMFHPDRKDLVFATVEAQGTRSGIWRSTDGGKSWVHAGVKEGLPTGDQFGRTTLAMARRSKTIYAFAGQQGTHQLLGVYRSDDLGETWMKCAKGGFANDGQLAYTNCIAMDAAHPMTAVLGSLELYRTRNGGKTWHQISQGKNPFSPAYLHRDHHALWIGHGRIYSASDGGFAVSMDGGDTWEARNKGLAIAMLYDVAVAPTNSGCIGCAMQDNGTWFAGALDKPEPGMTPPVEFRQELEGDGGWACYDPDDETHVYASQQRMDLWRHRDADGWTNLDLSVIPAAERRSVWLAVIVMDRSPSKRRRTTPRAVYVGSNRLWRTLDDGDTWEPVSDPFDGSIISAVEVARADPRFIYVGTENGGFYRSSDRGSSWSRNLVGPESPGRIITRIAADPEDPRRVFCTVGVIAETWFPADKGSQATSRILRMGLDIRRQDGKQGFAEFRHVYFTEDAGDTWNDGDTGLLPNLPHNSVIVSAGREVVVAHDGGVAVWGGNFGSKVGTPKWFDITGNLPNIRVTDLVFHERDGLLVVSTYGRGAWKITVQAVAAWLKQRGFTG